MSYRYKQATEQGEDMDEEVAQQAETFQIQTLMKMFAVRFIDQCNLICWYSQTNTLFSIIHIIQ